MQKLNQVISVEKGIKKRVYDGLSELHKANQKPALFDGFQKNYVKRAEDGEDFPAEDKRVQMNVNDVLKQIKHDMTELFDITAAKDYANCSASADVVVDGAVLVTKAPATYLLFLEKQLTDLHALVEKLPVLNPAEDWSPVDNLWRSKVRINTKSKKVQKALVLYPHSAEHPAQAQMITEDVTVGHWEQVNLSGAIKDTDRKALLERTEKLQKAVKFALEEANSIEAPRKDVGAKIFEWLLS